MKSQSPTRNLVLAVDGSEHAQAALQLVSALPLPESCQITVIAVLIPRNVQYHHVLEKVLEQSREILQDKHPGHIHTELITGYPAEEIVAYAKAALPDLIVLGARGLRSTLGILLGGVAQHVVEYARCPVLVVRAPFKGLWHVLFATDGSNDSQYALEYLERCPLPERSKKTVIHVLPPDITPDMLATSWQISMEMTPPIMTEQMQTQITQKAQDEEASGQTLIKENLAILETLGKPASGVLRRGDAATEIIDFAREQEIDLIVVGSRGLSSFRGWLLGSVSRKLVHYADCSVLIVKKTD